jgi:acid stress-induced BolA-like protein IbaG/YrbA
MISPFDIESWLKAELPEAKIEVSGDGQHFEAVIISEAFAGKSLLQRQRMVYSALGERMKNIHALSMKTLTPDQIYGHPE